MVGLAGPVASRCPWCLVSTQLEGLSPGARVCHVLPVLGPRRLAQPGGWPLSSGPPSDGCRPGFLGHLSDSDDSFQITGSLYLTAWCGSRPRPAVRALVLMCAHVCPWDVPFVPADPVWGMPPASCPAFDVWKSALLSQLLAGGARGISSSLFSFGHTSAFTWSSSPGGTVATSADTFCCHNWVPCFWHHVWRLEILLNLLKCTEQPPQSYQD